MSRNVYLIYKNTKKPIKEILQLSEFQINWLLFNINKDEEEKAKLIEAIMNTLKFYINPELYKEEQKAKKEKEHKTLLDESLKNEFKDKGLSDNELKDLEKFFK